MKLTTSKGKIFEIDWMWGPTGLFGDLMIQLHDSRPLSKIANDFEGCEHFHRTSEDEGDMDWEGYTNLKSIIRPMYEVTHDIVQITLSKQ